MNTKVYVIKRENRELVQEVVLRALRTISLKKIVSKIEEKILINPNWVTSDHSDTGNVTSTDVLEGIIIYLLKDAKIPSDKIIVADGGTYGVCESVMKLNDVFRLEEYGVKVMDLNSDERINDIKIPNPFALKSVNVAKTVMDASCIISVPSLKTHRMATTTLSMKNIMGVILPKGIMHSKIHQKIADLVSLLRFKMKFQIIDGIIGSSGSELGGTPIKMDLIIAGEDPVAVDRVGSAIIGYDPDKVKYLKFAEKKGLGTANLEKIEIIGTPIKEVYHKF
ncbi:MAG: DUF362 domain-containing protein [Promethearchaeota archaeon]